MSLAMGLIFSFLLAYGAYLVTLNAANTLLSTSTCELILLLPLNVLVNGSLDADVTCFCPQLSLEL